jgi:hypothetical protein
MKLVPKKIAGPSNEHPRLLCLSQSASATIEPTLPPRCRPAVRVSHLPCLIARHVHPLMCIMLVKTASKVGHQRATGSRATASAHCTVIVRESRACRALWTRSTGRFQSWAGPRALAHVAFQAGCHCGLSGRDAMAMDRLGPSTVKPFLNF